MASKNIYDDNEFFKDYINIRNEAGNYNDLQEQPIIFSMLGDLRGKNVLDVGCGYGSTAFKIHKKGAKSVLGIDISQTMLQKAREENFAENIYYKHLDISDLNKINTSFDIVVSCLVFHYIKDLKQTFSDIHKLLNDEGLFVFSIQHPIHTANKYMEEWLFNKSGEVKAFALDHYAEEGKRYRKWIDKPIERYHHKIETIINSLIQAPFNIVSLAEPSPTPEMMKNHKKTIRELHRPVSMIIKCTKK